MAERQKNVTDKFNQWWEILDKAVDFAVQIFLTNREDAKETKKEKRRTNKSR